MKTDTLEALRGSIKRTEAADPLIHTKRPLVYSGRKGMSDQEPNKMLDVEFYITAAQNHGEADDPDHEVGDLQDFLRGVWDLLTPEQILAFAKDPETHRVIGVDTDFEDELARLQSSDGESVAPSHS